MAAQTMLYLKFGVIWKVAAKRSFNLNLSSRFVNAMTDEGEIQTELTFNWLGP